MSFSGDQDVSNLIPSDEKLDTLGADFVARTKAKGDGLSLAEFVEMMLHYLTDDTTTKEHQLTLVRELVELFNRIDFNGDNSLEWEEFTSYCVEAGLVASRTVQKPPKYKWRVDDTYRDKEVRTGIRFVRYAPDHSDEKLAPGVDPTKQPRAGPHGRVYLIEHSSRVLQIFDTNGVLLNKLHVQIPLPFAADSAGSRAKGTDRRIITSSAGRVAAVRDDAMKKGRAKVAAITSARLQRARRKQRARPASAGLLSTKQRAARDKAIQFESSSRLVAGVHKGSSDIDDFVLLPHELRSFKSRVSASTSEVLSIKMSHTREVFKQDRRRKAHAKRVKRLKAADALHVEPTLLQRQGAIPVHGLPEDEDDVDPGALLSAEFVPGHRMIAVSCSDLTITLWDADTFEYKGALHSASVQPTMRWCRHVKLLLTSGGGSGVVQAWNVVARKVVSQIPDEKLVAQGLCPRRHTDYITDILEVPHPHDLIVTAGMDRQILMWSFDASTADGLSTRFRFAGSLDGAHRQGLRQLVYSEEHDILFSVAFGLEAMAWDLASRLVLFTLSGHRHTLLGLCLSNSSPQHAVTADIEGNFKVWDVSRNSAKSTAPLVQVFDGSTELGVFAPTQFVGCGNAHTIVAGGRSLKVFRSVRLTDSEDKPAPGLFCPELGCFVTATGTTLNIWDALTGQSVKKFYGICGSAINELQLGCRGRQLLVGNAAGEVMVLNGLDGHCLKAGESHGSEIVSVVYNPEDSIIISAAWNGSIYIQDDLEDPEELTPLRSIHDAHDSDISAMQFDRTSSIMASGDASGVVRMWDFQSLKMLGACRGHTSEITTIQFASPMPLLQTTDGTGHMYFWATRPSLWNGRCLLGIVNQGVQEHVEDSSDDDSAPTTRNKAELAAAAAGKRVQARQFRPSKFDGPVAITAVQTVCTLIPHSRYATLMIYTGDEQGYIKLWDLSRELCQLPVQPIPAAKQPASLNSYNPRRRIDRYYRSEVAERVNTRGQAARAQGRWATVKEAANKSADIRTSKALSAFADSGVRAGQRSTLEETMRSQRPPSVADGEEGEGGAVLESTHGSQAADDAGSATTKHPPLQISVSTRDFSFGKLDGDDDVEGSQSAKLRRTPSSVARKARRVPSTSRAGQAPRRSSVTTGRRGSVVGRRGSVVGRRASVVGRRSSANSLAARRSSHASSAASVARSSAASDDSDDADDDAGVADFSALSEALERAVYVSDVDSLSSSSDEEGEARDGVAPLKGATPPSKLNRANTIRMKNASQMISQANGRPNLQSMGSFSVRRDVERFLRKLRKEKSNNTSQVGAMRGAMAVVRAKRSAVSRIAQRKQLDPVVWAKGRIRQDLEPVTIWKAHGDAIRSLNYSKRANILISSSHDLSVRLWTPGGVALGVLSIAREDEKLGIADLTPWKFKIDTNRQRAEAVQHAREILAHIERTRKLNSQRSKRHLQNKQLSFTDAKKKAVQQFMATLLNKSMRRDILSKSKRMRRHGGILYYAKVAETDRPEENLERKEAVNGLLAQVAPKKPMPDAEPVAEEVVAPARPDSAGKPLQGSASAPQFKPGTITSVAMAVDAVAVQKTEIPNVFKPSRSVSATLLHGGAQGVAAQGSSQVRDASSSQQDVSGSSRSQVRFGGSKIAHASHASGDASVSAAPAAASVASKLVSGSGRAVVAWLGVDAGAPQQTSAEKWKAKEDLQRRVRQRVEAAAALAASRARHGGVAYVHMAKEERKMLMSRTKPLVDSQAVPHPSTFLEKQLGLVEGKLPKQKSKARRITLQDKRTVGGANLLVRPASAMARTGASATVVPPGGVTRDVIRPPVRRSRQRPASAPLFRKRRDSYATSSSGSSVHTYREVTEQALSRISSTVDRLNDALDDPDEIQPQRKQSFHRVSLVRRETMRMEEMRAAAAKSGVAGTRNIEDVMARSVRERRFGDYSEKDVTTFKKMYQDIDADGSGVIDIEEFMSSPAFQTSDLFFLAKSTFRSLDADGSGEVELEELLAVAFPLAQHKHIANMSSFIKATIRDELVRKEAQRKRMRNLSSVAEQ